MDWFPLENSIRISLISTLVTFLTGIVIAYYVAKLNKVLKGVIDVILTLPMVLPPTVIGFFILTVISPKSTLGGWIFEEFNQRITMTWQAAIIATTIVTFPLMYRTARGAFEHIDETLIYSGRTLGLSDAYIFWRIILPNAKQGIIAGTVLAFARGLGEYGATSMVSGYMPGKTATISTTVYHLWQIGDEELAYRWVGINLIISFVVLVAVNFFEKRSYQSNGVRV